MNHHEIYELVRKIDPANFSQTAHGPGWRVVLEPSGRCEIQEPGVLKRMFSRRDVTHYFVKKLPAPLVVETWTFNWSEGTSAISLDFASTFSLGITQPDEACSLVKALAAHASVGQSLFDIISAALYDRLAHLAGSSETKGRNLLAHFRDSSVGVAESEKLNNQVSKKVADSLGCGSFRIGLRLGNMPPMQISVESRDTFKLADSTRTREVETRALLEFDNYQAYRKSGLVSETEVRDAIKQSISATVKRNLFAMRYHDVVKSFARPKTSLEARMRADIAADARRLGFRVRMFQSFPNIAALELLGGIRIDIPADAMKYHVKDAIGYVQIEVALSVKAGDLERLHRLVDPDDKTEISQIIVERVQQICRDEIQKVRREDFNLRFDEDIAPALGQLIVSGLSHYGLDADIVKIVQAPTEEAFRYRALCGEPATPFFAEVSPQGDSGAADHVRVEGLIEISGMLPNGWEQFERKDFGFRAGSGATEQDMRQRAARVRRPVPDGPLTLADRRAIAVAFELDEIRQRVVRIVRARLANEPALGHQWTTREASEEFEALMQAEASKVIAQEFGLSIRLRGIVRHDTASEITQQGIRASKQHVLREKAKADGAAAADALVAAHVHATQLRQERHEARLKAVREAVENNDEDMLSESITKTLDALDKEEGDLHRLDYEGAADVLHPPKKPARSKLASGRKRLADDERPDDSTSE